MKDTHTGNKKVNLCFITSNFPDNDQDANGLFIKQTADYLADSGGFNISIITPRYSRAAAAFEERQGMKIYRFSFWSSEKSTGARRRVGPHFSSVLRQ